MVNIGTCNGLLPNRTISEVLWLSPESNFTANVDASRLYNGCAINALELLSYLPETNELRLRGPTWHACPQFAPGEEQLRRSDNRIANSGIILGLRPANERRRYFVTTSLIGWAQLSISPAIGSKYRGRTKWPLICRWYFQLIFWKTRWHTRISLLHIMQNHYS